MPHTDDHTVDSVIEAKRSVERILRDKANVHAVSVGHKEVGGEETDDLAIVVHVTSKEAEEALEESDIVPARINVAGRDPVPTDVRESPIPTPDSSSLPPRFPRDTTFRPLAGGVRITSENASGTLGGIVETADGTPHILTNRHIVQDDSTIEPPAGGPVYQPYDGDGPIGSIEEWSEWDSSTTNTSDSALCSIEDGIGITDHVLTVGRMGEPRTGSLGDDYAISGVSSEGTAATLTEIDYTGTIGHEPESLTFSGQYVLSPHRSEGGDSGALWGEYDPESGKFHPIGLNFAGGSVAGGSIATPWSALEDTHGDLSPPSQSTLGELTSASNVIDSIEYIPLNFTTGNRAVLKCIGARYGDPNDLPEEDISLHYGGLDSDGLASGRVIGTHQITSGWGEVEEFEFSGLHGTLGEGTHTLSIGGTYVNENQFEVQVTEPTEHRVYGSIRTQRGGRIADVTVDIYGNRNELVDTIGPE